MVGETMLNLDNSTTISLTGLICIIFGAVQLVLFRKRGLPVIGWAASQVLLGLGLIGILYLNKSPLNSQWIFAPLSILLGGLVNLGAISLRFGYKLPKKPTLICLGGVVLVGVLFEFSRGVGAPLGSLEAILLAPLSAIYIYTAWFCGTQAKLIKSKYSYMISAIFWLTGLFISALTLGALAAVGDEYIIVTSDVVYVTSLVYLVGVLVNNMTWSIQISEDLLVRVVDKKNATNINIGNLVINKNAEPSISTSPIKEKKISTRVLASNIEIVNVDVLSDQEKLTLLDKLTEKEREVCILVSDGKKNTEIASMLNSSESSIKVHKSRLTAKLGIKAPADLKKLLSVKSTNDVTAPASVDLTFDDVQKSLLT
jgi:DNA-binding CsgD family transcriptional regulator